MPSVIKLNGSYLLFFCFSKQISAGGTSASCNFDSGAGDYVEDGREIFDEETDKITKNVGRVHF